jgi:hypothetical protein
MWCVEEYFDMHQLTYIVVRLIVRLLVSSKYLLTELVIYIGFEFRLICPVEWKSGDVYLSTI